MRREGELFYKNKTLGLASDCVYVAFQTHQITENEMVEIERLLKDVDEEILNT